MGDERKNIGLVTRAILEQPDKTLGKWVIGQAFSSSCREWAVALNNVFKEDKLTDKEVAYVETTLEGYEAIWGVVGTEIGGMMKYLEEVDDAFSNPGGDTVLFPKDLGVKQEDLGSLEQGLRGYNWAAIL